MSYSEREVQVEREIPAFRKAEMKYRRQLRSKEKTDYSDVIDFDHVENHLDLVEEVILSDEKRSNLPSSLFGNREHFKAYKIKGKEGFYFLRRPFTEAQQQHWIKRCVCDFTAGAQHSLEAHYDIEPGKNLWDFLYLDKEPKWNRKDMPYQVAEDPREEGHSKKLLSGEQLFLKLRWLTLGYKYNWTEKVYLDGETPFPQDLALFGREGGKLFGFDGYQSESAIVNYYHYGDTLTGHTDRSEINCTAPIVSASFGHTAIFLLGSQSRETDPVALFIKSGDAVVMSGESRTAYHGIPRVVENSLPEHLKYPNESVGYTQDLVNYMSDTRVNMNVRQVFD